MRANENKNKTKKENEVKGNKNRTEPTTKDLKLKKIRQKSRLRELFKFRNKSKNTDKTLQKPISKFQPSVSSQKNVYSKIFSLFLVLILSISLVPSAFAEQLPMPQDATTVAGSPSFAVLTNDLVGDRSSYTAPVSVDIDADGDYDMFIGRLDGLLEYWRNDGDSTNPVWVLDNSDVLGDIGTRASPTFYDFDQDGDFDMLIGEDDGSLNYYRNDGTPESFSFTYIRNIVDLGSYTNPIFWDYNQDGDVDIVYGRDQGYIYKWKNDVGESGLNFNHFWFNDVGSRSSPTFVDIDNDGDQDVFMGASDGWVRFFENQGGTSSQVFDTQGESFFADPVNLFDVGSTSDIAFADLDNDNDQDMLVGKSDGVFDYYRNDGTVNNPFWTLVPGFFTADVGDTAAATFADIDNDGDMDLLVGNAAGFMSLYENQGDANSANFVLSGSNLIGDVGSDANPIAKDMDGDLDYDLVIGRSDGYLLFYNNTGNLTEAVFTAGPNVLSSYIAYTTPALADIDGDGDLDLAVGSGQNGGWTNLLENTGDATTFSFSTQRTFWLENRYRGFTTDFQDIDGDGDLDMIAGSEHGYIYLYRNDGDETKPKWTYLRELLGDYGSWTSPKFADLNGDGTWDFTLGRTNDVNIRYWMNDVENYGFNFTLNNSDVIGDIGGYSAPEYEDLDNDGDKDLIVGTQDGRTRYYRNDGDNFNPVYVIQSDLIGDIGSHSHPSFADIDDDGDLDMVVGRSDADTLSFYRNDGNATNHSFTFVTHDYFVNWCRPGDGASDYCAPEFIDADNDGDYDLYAGGRHGYTRFWRNDGTPSIAVWSDQGDVIGDWGSYSSVTTGDLDGDGDKDLIIGESAGRTLFYKNTGTPESPAYTYIYAGNGAYSYLPVYTSYAKPQFVDIDGDGDLDVGLGWSNGITRHYQNNGLWETTEEKTENPVFIHADTTVLPGNCRPGNNDAGCNHDYVDMDDDGDLDVVAATWSHPPRYYENIGDPQAYIFVDRGDLISDYGNRADFSLADMDGDGDKDMMVGYEGGNTIYFKNTGSLTSPAMTYIYRSNNGNNYLTDYGSYAQIDLNDFNNDGLIDIAFSEDIGGASNTDFYILRNKGIPFDPKERAVNPTWQYSGSFFQVSGNRYYNRPTVADVDGDGDVDMIVGDDINRMHLYRNEGTFGNPIFVYDSLLFDFGSDWGRPSFVDYDGDGDFDFLSGSGDGFIRLVINNGDYFTATTLTLKDESGTAIVGASTVFSDGGGVVCSNTTDTKGQVRCEINFIGGSGSVAVTGADSGTASFGILSPNSNGNTFITLDNPGESFNIDLERFQFNAHDVNNDPATMRVKVADDGVTVFSALTDNSGFVDGFFPRKYLINRQEPYTQNRIKYDILLEANSDYESELNLNGIFTPNVVNFNSDTDSEKLYKFLSTNSMSTDAQYSGFIIFPALTAQREYELSDSIPSDFDYLGDVVTSYLGQECTKAISGSAFTLDFNDAGCEFLAEPVTGTGDWLKYEYVVKTPTLDDFITLNISENNYSFPAAQLTLIS